jgi:hypothetical protein
MGHICALRGANMTHKGLNIAAQCAPCYLHRTAGANMTHKELNIAAAGKTAFESATALRQHR